MYNNQQQQYDDDDVDQYEDFSSTAADPAPDLNEQIDPQASRKSKKSSLHPKSRKIAKKPTSSMDTSRLQGLDPDAQARVMQLTREIDQVLAKPSSRSDGSKDPHLLEHRALALVNDMRQAAAHDQNAHAAQTPGLAKLNMLPDLINAVERADMRDILLDSHLLGGMLAWLEPMEADGSLPQFEVRKSMFEMLMKLPITTDHLHDDKIGRIVMFYAKYPKETDEIRQMATQCINKWSRPILNISDTYTSTVNEKIDVDLHSIRRNRVLAPRNATSSPGTRLQLPMSQGTGYTVRPSDNLPSSHRSQQQAASGLSKMISKLKQQPNRSKK